MYLENVVIIGLADVRCQAFYQPFYKKPELKTSIHYWKIFIIMNIDWLLLSPKKSEDDEGEERHCVQRKQYIQKQIKNMEITIRQDSLHRPTEQEKKLSEIGLLSCHRCGSWFNPFVIVLRN